MSTREAMSHAALGWVKPELDQTLLQMRQQIQDYVEEPGDGQQMLQAATWLHQVQGTLRMVELYAPAMVAEELELLARAVHQGRVADTEDACALLMRGTVLLPDYLERLQNGHRDIPIVLLPLLNEIRAARGAEGLNEAVLLALGPEASEVSAEELEHARGSLAGRNRELLATVGGVVKEELLRIKDALDLHLRTGAHSSALQSQVNELGAVADTLAMMGLDGARELILDQRKTLVGVVEQQGNIDEDLLLEIAGSLLYVDASLDDQVASLGSAGRGEDDASTLETQRTIEILAAEAITNFAHAREHFVAFIETNWDHARLADVPRLLGDVSGALRILDMDEPAQYVTGVQRYIQAELIGRLRIPSGRQLDTLADAMASLEYFLEGVRERRPGGAEILEISRSSLQALRYWPLPAIEDEAAVMAAPDVAVAAVQADAGDAVTSLAGMATGGAVEPIDLIEAVEAVETDMAPAAGLTSELPAADNYPYVFAASHQRPEASGSPFDPVMAEDEAPVLQAPVVVLPELEPTADALPPLPTGPLHAAAFDPLLAELADQEPVDEQAVLPLDPALLLADDADLAVPAAQPDYSGRGLAVEDELRAAGLPAAGQVAALDPVLTEGATLITPQALEWSAEEAAFLSELDASTLSLPGSGVATPVAADTPDAVPVPHNEAGFQDAGSLVDADTLEIREVFLEEFDEELANLKQMLPTWSANPGLTAQLLPVRRVFHTLKGSGRLVGARTLGEFSWSIESMLNRVRDGLRPASPAVVAMVALAVDEVLPQLYAALHDGSPVHADLLAIQGVAERIAAGEEIYYVPAAAGSAANAATRTPEPEAGPEAEPQPQAAGGQEAPVQAGTPAAVDSVLLDILQAEVTTHLATLRGWLAASELEPQPVDETLLRAVHTMSGAFAMTEVPEITAVTGASEALVKRLLAAAQAPAVGDIAALSGASAAIAQTLQALQAEQPLIPHFSDLVAQLQQQVDRLPEARNPLINADEAWLDEPAAALPVDSLAEQIASELATESSSIVADDLSAFLDPALLLPDADAIDAMVEAAAQQPEPAAEDETPGLSAQAPLMHAGAEDAALPSVADEAPAVEPVALTEAPALSLELAEDENALLSIADDVPAIEQAALAEVSELSLELAEDENALLSVADDVPATEQAALAEVSELSLELAEDENALLSVADDVPAIEQAALAEVPELSLELTEDENALLSIAEEAPAVEPVSLTEAVELSLELAEDESALLSVADEVPAVEPVALTEAAELSLELTEDENALLSVADETPAVEPVALTEAPELSLEPAEDENALLTVADETPAVEPAALTEAPELSLEPAEDENALLSVADEVPGVEPVALTEAPELSLEPAEDENEDALLSVADEMPGVEPVALTEAPELSLEPAEDEDALLSVADEPSVVEPASVDPVPAAALPDAPHFEMEPTFGTHQEAGHTEAGSTPADDTPAVDLPLDFNLLDLELVDIFVEEGKDLLDHCDGLLAELRADPEDREAVAGLQRDLHTLKGGARMAGINAIGDLAHSVESLLEARAADRLVLGEAEVRLLENGFDRLHQMVTRTGEHQQISLPMALVAAFEARTQGLDLQVEQADVPVAERATETLTDATVVDLRGQPEPLAQPVAAAQEDLAGQDNLPVSGLVTIAGVLDIDEPADEPVSAVGAPHPVEAETETETAAVAAGNPADSTIAPLAGLAAASITPLEMALNPAQSVEPAIAAQPLPALAVALEPLSAPVDDEEAVGEEGARPGQEQVRVRADLLDRLVGHAGEVAIYRSRLEQQLGAFRGAMAELDRTNARLRDQLRRLDLETEAQIVARYQREDSADRTFDPLELDRFSTLQQLSRALNESAADLSGLQGVLDDLARNYDNLLGQQSRVSSELQDGLMRARMVPFDGIVPRLRRVVRQAAADIGKQVRLVVEGTQGELDRNVLDRMVAPLEHMLRNSVAHGIELPAARLAAGKPEEGVITLQLRREGSEIALEVADDGAGLDRAAIRRRAEQRGLLQADNVLSEHELDSLIFAAGFSTADQVSQLAGRGVGMDVVRNEVRQLGGSVDIRSETGRGARFVMRLPQTLAVTQAVFAQIGETTYAVPVASVSGIGRIARERFEAGDGIYRYGGEEYALYDLGLLVGQGPAKAEGQAQVPLLLVRAGDLRAAVAIDQVVGNREVVVKPVGMQIASVPGIYGATITGEGNVVVILDVAPLVRRLLSQPSRQPAATIAAPARQVPLVMVVDDSLTMRKVTGRVLERHNFEVSAARDGIEALEQLEERVPDLMLLDIEMPRMDGYELATAMRADPRYKDVPIIMITSRTGDKHRQRALEIGVQRYLGKPYQEPELMRNVYDLLGISRARE